MRCESCGNENEMNNTFCTKCGSPLNNNQNNNQPNLTDMYNQPNLNQMYNQNNNNQQMNNNNQSMNNGMQMNFNNTHNNQQPNSGMQMNFNNTQNNQQPNGGMQMNFNNIQNNQQPNSGMQMKLNQPNNNQNDKKEKNKKSNGKASLIIGLVCIPLLFIFGIIAIPVAIVGLIIGISAGKKGLAGSLLNGSILAIIGVLTGIGLYVILNDGYKMYGNYKCISYYDSYTEEDLKNITEDDLDIEIEINLDDTFRMASEKSNLEVKGKFELTETKTSEMYNTDYYTLKMKADYRKIEGKEYTEPYETEYVFSIAGKNKNAAYVYNPKSMSQYICKRSFVW